MQNTFKKKEKKKQKKARNEENPFDKTENSVRSSVAFASHTPPLPPPPTHTLYE